MILGFKKYFPGGERTYFKEKIFLSAIDQIPEPLSMELIEIFHPKIHTIRAKKGRWKPGDQIHMAYGVRTKDYEQFNNDIPKLQTVIAVQRIDIHIWGDAGEFATLYIDKKLMFARSRKHELGAEWMKQFVRNDGFHTVEHFLKIFRWLYGSGGQGEGCSMRNAQLIHWTNYLYE